MKPVIIIVTYSRPQSLRRLLSSLNKSDYKSFSNITLIISIDGGGPNEVNEVALGFNWIYGEKKIIRHSQNLGLQRHILRCIQLCEEYESIILLEDDLYVSPHYYSYAVSALAYYNYDDHVAGISLYSPKYNDVSVCNFEALESGYDVYFMKIPASCGQAWTSKQWISFKSFLHTEDDIKSQIKLPRNARNWPNTSSWKKKYYEYMISNNKYFLYPVNSYSTNLGDPGEHFTIKTNDFNSPLFLGKKDLNFCAFENNSIKYNERNELAPEFIKLNNPDLNDFDFDTDLYDSLGIGECGKPYLLSTKKCNNPILTYSRELFPIEINVLLGSHGEGISLAKTNDFEFNDPSHSQIREYMVKSSFIRYMEVLNSRSYKKGISDMKSSADYKIGNMFLKPMRLVMNRKRNQG